MEKMGYNALLLYTEDTYEVEGEPLFGYMRGRYSKDDLKELTAFGEQHGVEMIPCFQTLGHMERMFRWSKYSKIRDNQNVMLVGEEETYALIEKMFATWRECYKTDVAKIGMDEAAALGLGKYLKKHGYENPFEILGKHMKRVSEIAHKYGFTPVIDADTFFRQATGGEYYVNDPNIITPDIVKLFPEDAEVIYWDYFPSEQQCRTMIEAHRRFNRPIWFSASVNSWTGFVSHNRSAVYWMSRSLHCCAEAGVENICITQWGDDGGEASVFGSLPAFFYASQVLHGNNDLDDIKQKFKAMFGIDFDDFCRQDDAVNYLNNPKSTFNSEKPVLYNDPFCGIYDDLVPADMAEFDARYAGYLESFRPLCEDPTYGYLFKTSYALCDVIRHKMDLGVCTRTMYLSGDKKGLDELIARYDLVREKVDAFYQALRTTWYKERKGYGFEVQAARLGGLKQRLDDCKQRLIDYRDGLIDHIEELEEPVLAIHEPNENFKDNRYIQTAGANML